MLSVFWTLSSQRDKPDGLHGFQSVFSWEANVDTESPAPQIGGELGSHSLGLRSKRLRGPSSTRDWVVGDISAEEGVVSLVIFDGSIDQPI